MPIAPRQSIGILKYLYPLPLFVCVEENSPRLSLWSTIAVPHITARANQCILKYSHSHLTEAEFRTRASATFLTEPNGSTSIDQDGKALAGKDGFVIRAVEWFSNNREDKSVLCIGDETGHIQLLDINPLLRRMDHVKNRRASVSMTSSPLLANSEHELFSAMLLQKVTRWSTTTQRGVGIRRIHAQSVNCLIHSNANKRAIVLSVDDYGSVQLWSLDGLRLGGLQCGSSTLRTDWKLDLDIDELKQRTRYNAESILRQVEHKHRVAGNQEKEGDISASALHKGDRLTIRAPSSVLHGPAPPQAATPFRPPGLSAEEALVVWRRPIHKHSSHRSIRLPTKD